MRTTSGAGYSYIVTNPITDSDAIKRVKYWQSAEPPRVGTGKVGNVVGGSLDGSTFPAGTRDGQQYRWCEERQRWIEQR